MRYSDHFLITEAWRRAEQFEREARCEQLLARYRKARTASWQRRLARLLVRLAGWLEPQPKLPPKEACTNG